MPPLFDADSDAAWAEAYNPPYLRVNRDRIVGPATQRILPLLVGLGLRVDDPTLVVGGGFGWGMEQSGMSNFAIIDSSRYIQDRKATEAILPILDNSLMSEAERDEVVAALGGVKPKWVSTEDVLSALTDEEIAGLIGNIHAVIDPDAGGAVVHIVSRVLEGEPLPAIQYNWRTLDQWATFIASVKGSNSPRHIIISLNHVAESRDVI